ncbi:hypothetical protein [Streptococcus sp. 20-1249]|uniref:hypothetical protein n=1 Tax=Streptococcus hepaticus TaxID=3349163 RepID=UPI002987FFD2
MNYIALLPDPRYALALVTLSESMPVFLGFPLGVFADKTKNKLSMILGTLFFRTMLYLLMTVIMGTEPSLVVVLIASVVNFFSDISGKYENSLYTQISLRLIVQVAFYCFFC